MSAENTAIPKMKGHTSAPASKMKAGPLRGQRVPPTPYTRGFEDYVYQHEYAKGYTVGSARWREYDQGNADARKTEKEAEP